jgi:hypothetical protein
VAIGVRHWASNHAGLGELEGEVLFPTRVKEKDEDFVAVAGADMMQGGGDWGLAMYCNLACRPLRRAR